MKDTIKKLYNSGNLTNNGVINAITKGIITYEDAKDILGVSDTQLLEFTKTVKIFEIKEECSKIITSGVDVVTSNGNNHFNLSIEDQSNIGNLFNIVLLGGEEYPYQADNGECVIYSSDDIMKIYVASQTLITTQLTYHNILKSYIQDLSDIDTINSITYGQELTGSYLSLYNEKLLVAQGQINQIISKVGTINENIN